MLPSRCDSPPPSYAQALNDIARADARSSAVSPPSSSCVVPREWRVQNRACEDGAREGAYARAQQPRRSMEHSAGGGETKEAFSSATILRACLSLNKLDPSIRYHFGNRPVSYAALSHALGAFVACLPDYGAMLMSRGEAGGKPEVDVSQSADLLAAMRTLDVQYGLWENIIRDSREPILRVRRAQLGRAGANPFIAMRRDLQSIKECVVACLLQSAEPKRDAYGI